MTRETRIGLAVGLAFTFLFAVILSDRGRTVALAQPGPKGVTSVNHSFGWALTQAKLGALVRLSHWDEGQYVGLKSPESGQAMTEPFLYMIHPTRGTVPWIPAHAELLSEDWSAAGGAGGVEGD